MGGAWIVRDRVTISNDIKNSKILDGKTYVPRSDIFKQYLEKSDKTTQHEKYGTMRYYHLNVGDGKILENGACYFDGEEAKEMKDYIGFLVTRSGDPGNPHFPLDATPEGDGVTIEEDWFG